jgi:hypothetical protein
LETPLLRYSGSSVLSVLNPLNCMETNSKRSWCKMDGFLTLGFWGCLISSANWGVWDSSSRIVAAVRTR